MNRAARMGRLRPKGFGAPGLLLLLIATAFQSHTRAHIGSPDVFVEANAGPYRLFVTVRPPLAIPGVADVEVLATTDEVREVRIVPLPLTGPPRHSRRCRIARSHPLKIDDSSPVTCG